MKDVLCFLEEQIATHKLLLEEVMDNHECIHFFDPLEEIDVDKCSDGGIRASLERIRYCVEIHNIIEKYSKSKEANDGKR